VKISDNIIPVLVVFITQYHYYLIDCYDWDEVYNDLSYDIKYSSNNIENGMRHFVENHPLKFRTSENEKGIDGSVDVYRRTVKELQEYLKILKENNNPITSMVYLAIGWSLLDSYCAIRVYFERNLNFIKGRPDNTTNLEFQVKSLMSDIVFRANLLSVNTAQGRQFLSLFDSRTYDMYNRSFEK